MNILYEHRQLTTSSSDAFLPPKFLTTQIQQKNNSKQNVNYNEIMNRVIFFSSDGFSLDSVRNLMVEDEFNSLTNEGDITNINFMSTEIIPDDESTGTYKMATESESTETIDYLSTTASYDSSVSIHWDLIFINEQYWTNIIN